MSDIGTSKQKRVVRLLVAATLLGFIIFFLAVMGQAYFILRSPGWHEWADFTVPTDAIPLHADVKIRLGEVTVCNAGYVPWKDALVQITDGYLAQVKSLAPAECRHFKLNDFRTNPWKKMPPPRDLVIGHVEILANVTTKGYAEWPGVSSK